ncbi:hypothetical protein [Paenibacillus pinistramenti]|uniref:hypothetical protein n=1 Tax=Paenibacillus pinistramenti TaxID=1768003 RepID=UPI001109EAD2|nr:hypothetical protein [Paenibacillus pinistramenti]
MSRHKPYLLIIFVLMLTLALTACGSNSPEANDTQPAASGLENVSQSVEPSASASSDEADGVLKGTGKYVGLGDTSSIEIEMDGQPVVFQLGTVDESVINSLNSGDQVTFQYKEQEVEGDPGVKLRTLIQLQQGAGQSGSEGAAEALPETKDLSVTLEGNTEERSAKLVQTDDYALYLPDGFSFDKENNKLYLTAYPEYFATIYKLPSDYNMDYLKLEADQEMSDNGRVKEITGDDVAEPMRDAKLVEIVNGPVRVKQYIVKELDGQDYVLRLEIPNGEPSEGFQPLAYAALNSLINKK